MHLYQYLPGKFKVDKAEPPQKIDTLDHTTTKNAATSSVLTPREKNVEKTVEVKPHTTGALNPTSKAEAEKFKKLLDTRPQKKAPPKHKDSMPTTLDFSESTVVSEVTTPTVLTCPKIGPGYSDCLSVTSDLTTPTVMPGGSPFGRQPQHQQQTSMLEMPKQVREPQMRSRSEVLFNSSKFLERAQSAPPAKRRASANDTRPIRDGTKPKREKQRRSSTEKRSRSHKKKKKKTEKSPKPDRDLTDRLAKLRMKSIRAPPKGKGNSMVSSAPSRLDMGSSGMNINGVSGSDASSPGRAASKKMEEILLATVQQLMDTEYKGDFEEEPPRNRRQCRSSSPKRKARH